MPRATLNVDAGSALPLRRLFGPDGLRCPLCGDSAVHPRNDLTAAGELLEENNTDPQLRISFSCETGGHRSSLKFHSHGGQTIATLQYDGEAAALSPRAEEEWRPRAASAPAPAPAPAPPRRSRSRA